MFYILSLLAFGGGIAICLAGVDMIQDSEFIVGALITFGGGVVALWGLGGTLALIIALIRALAGGGIAALKNGRGLISTLRNKSGGSGSSRGNTTPKNNGGSKTSAYNMDQYLIGTQTSYSVPGADVWARVNTSDGVGYVNIDVELCYSMYDSADNNTAHYIENAFRDIVSNVERSARKSGMSFRINTRVNQ